jgi:hypothetical protein
MPLENKQEIDNCVESLTNIIQIGISIAIPEKKNIIHNKYTRWWTPKLTDS